MIDEKMLFYELGKATGGGGSSAPIISELSITENGTYVADNCDGYSPIFVDIPQVELESIDITENGTYTAEDGKAFNEVVVDVKNVIPEEAFTIGYVDTFSSNGTQWFYDNFVDKTNVKLKASSTTSLKGLTPSAYQNTIEKLPWNEIDCNQVYLFSVTTQGIFTGAQSTIGAHQKLKELPKIKNTVVTALNYLFNGLTNIREIPEDLFVNSNTNFGTSSKLQATFRNCYSLRKIPQFMYEWMKEGIRATSSCYDNIFSCCYALDEIVGLAVAQTTLTSSGFNSAFDNCYRLSRITFEPNKTANWRVQVIDLSKCGYTTVSTERTKITGYNSGITADKEVNAKADYERLKNDPDLFATNVNYSRYNHDSAVETINSLPDCNAYVSQYGSPNTIKFTGKAGSGTDGGAINTLTEEEIAVATSRGWTVSFV